MIGNSRSLPIYKKVISNCSNYRGITLLSTTNNILFNFLLSISTPYAEEIIGDRLCGFRSNRSTTDHMH